MKLLIISKNWQKIINDKEKKLEPSTKLMNSNLGILIFLSKKQVLF